MKRIAFMMSIIVAGQLRCMELPVVAAEAETTRKNVTFLENMARWEALPRDLQILLLKYIVSTSKNGEEAGQKLRAMTRVSSIFYKLINDDAVNNQLLAAIADNFLHHDMIQAAQILRTNASEVWLSGILPDFVSRRINRILAEGEDPYAKVAALRRFMLSNQKINGILHNKYVKIWLIKKVLNELNYEFFEVDDQHKNGTDIAQLLYPNEITQDDRAELAYIDKQEDFLEQLQEHFSIPMIKFLIAKGMDVNYSPQHLIARVLTLSSCKCF